LQRGGCCRLSRELRTLFYISTFPALFGSLSQQVNAPAGACQRIYTIVGTSSDEGSFALIAADNPSLALGAGVGNTASDDFLVVPDG